MTFEREDYLDEDLGVLIHTNALREVEMSALNRDTAPVEQVEVRSYQTIDSAIAVLMDLKEEAKNTTVHFMLQTAAEGKKPNEYIGSFIYLGDPNVSMPLANSNFRTMLSRFAEEELDAN